MKKRVFSVFATMAIVAFGSTALADEKNAVTGCQSGQCVVQTLNPHAAPQPHAAKADAPEILQTLEQIVKAYSSGSLSEYEALLDNDCAYFDQEHNHMIQGKTKVVDHLKSVLAKHAPAGEQPLLAYTIDQPYIKVLGDTAVVTYRAFERIGGKSPMEAEGLITKIFIRSNSGWKQQYDSSSWHAK